MALALLDGSNANIDISLNSISYKCHFGYWSADFERQLNEATTFCGTGWRSYTPGMRGMNGRADGFLGKGVAGADPTASGFTSQTAVPIVLTADSGCTFTGTGFVNRVHTGVRAAGNSEFSLEFAFTGAVTTAWVVT
jgi:hypothetical protein